jgi:hypothetical protein
MNSRLDRLTLDIERHAAGAGWDQPPRLFALVDPGDLTPVDQGDLPEHSSLEELLAGISWPPEVLGTALTVERLMVPPSAETDMPPDEGEALRWLAEHPERQEIRLVVAVLRDGSRSSALRMRAHDTETSVLTGENLVPGLADALAATLAD